MTLKEALAALVAMTVAAVSAAADVLAAGAIRPDHEQRYSSLRTTLDQIADMATQVQQIAEQGQPEDPNAEAFAKLRAELAEARQALTSGGDLAALREDLVGRVETLALTVDHMADQLEKLTAAKG